MYRGVCGKTEAKSVGGAEYFVTFIDDKPRFISVYTLKRQKEVSKKFTEWKTVVECLMLRQLKDNALAMAESTLQESLKTA